MGDTNVEQDNRKCTMNSGIKNALVAKFIILIVLIGMITVSPTMVYASNGKGQHETIRVGFFAMDGYHMMDKEGNRSV